MKKRVTIISLLVLLMFSLGVSAQDVSKHNEQKKKLEEEIALINSQLFTTRSRQKTDLNTLLLTQRKIDARKELIGQIDKEIKGYNRTIAAKNKDITRLRSRLDTLKTYYERLIYNAYKNRDSQIWFMYIMASENLSQGLRRWSYLRNLSASVKSQTMAIKDAELDLTLEKEKLESLKKQSMAVQKEKQREYYTLTEEETNLTNSINSLKQKEKSMKSALEKKRKEMERLNKEIERILAATMKQQSKKGSDITIDQTLSTKFSENKGKFPWPVKDGVIVERFGQSYHPVFKNVKMPFNNGVNISAAPGAEALCIFDGVVKQILILPGYSQCILVQHGEYFTFYCKIKKAYVKSGDKIATGQPVGLIDTAEDKSTIIHFELWKGTEKQNPENWLRTLR